MLSTKMLSSGWCISPVVHLMQRLWITRFSACFDHIFNINELGLLCMDAFSSYFKDYQRNLEAARIGRADTLGTKLLNGFLTLLLAPFIKQHFLSIVLCWNEAFGHLILNAFGSRTANRNDMLLLKP